jgi:hypothetical protein
MASAGTISLVIDFRYKPARGREESLVAGRTQVKNTGNIDATDLELRTIKMIVFQQYAFGGASQVGGVPCALVGSVNTAGSLGNTVTFYSYKGSTKSLGRVSGGYPGTCHMGTVAGGTQKVAFIAIGA